MLMITDLFAFLIMQLKRNRKECCPKCKANVIGKVVECVQCMGNLSEVRFWKNELPMKRIVQMRETDLVMLQRTGKQWSQVVRM